jgi:hypothetical protein
MSAPAGGSASILAFLTLTETPVWRATSQERAFPRVAFHQLESRAAFALRRADRADHSRKTAARPEVEPQVAGFRRKLENLERIKEMPGPELREGPVADEVQLGLPFPEHLLVDFQSDECFT